MLKLHSCVTIAGFEGSYTRSDVMALTTHEIPQKLLLLSKQPPPNRAIIASVRFSQVRDFVESCHRLNQWMVGPLSWISTINASLISSIPDSKRSKRCSTTVRRSDIFGGINNGRPDQLIEQLILVFIPFMI